LAALQKKLRAPSQKRLPKALRHEQCAALLGAVRSPVCRGVLTVMYGCGLRIGEAVKVTVKDVDAQRMVLRVVGKGNKERLAPLAKPLYGDLRRMWTAHRNPVWLFGNKRGTNHINPGVVSKAFQSARLAAEIAEEVTPHCLRHSFATRLIEEGVPAETVRILLGHASIKTTQAYLHLTEASRKKLNDTVGGFSVPLFD
jgi:site-specific recombinase XerD